MRRKVLIILIMLVLVPTLLVGYAMDYYAQKAILNTKQESLAVITRMMDFHITRYYHTLLTNIEKKTKTDLIKRLLEPSRKDSDHFDNKDYQEIRMILLEDVSCPVVSGAIVNRSGATVLSSIPSEEGLMMDKTEFYGNIMNGDEAYLGLITITQNSDGVIFAVPIIDEEGDIVGILRQVLNLKPLKKYFYSMNDDWNSYVFLLRKNGSIVFQHDQENEAMLYNEYQNADTLDQLILDFKNNQLMEEEGIVEFERKGVAYTGAYKKIDQINCIAIASANREKMFEQLSQGREILLIISVFFIFISIAVGFNINKMFARPLKGISDSVRKVADGNLTVRCSNEGNGEFNELCGSINKMTESLEKSEKELRLSARIDSMTHLANRYAIYEVLDTLLYKHPNQALLLLNLDRFEEINDNLGHDVGDRILIEVGDILRKLPQHLCYPSRLVGDEFLVFITNWTAVKYPEKVAEKIIKEIRRIRFIDEICVDISVSIGVTYTTADRIDKKKLIKHSDYAMHKAKSSGKNSYFIYYPDLKNEVF